jgi:hypothetical protein
LLLKDLIFTVIYPSLDGEHEADSKEACPRAAT